MTAEDSKSYLRLLRCLVERADVSLKIRESALGAAGESADSWLDWPKFLLSEDPLAARFLEAHHYPSQPRPPLFQAASRIFSKLGDEERLALRKAARSSSLEVARVWAIRDDPLDREDAPEILRSALKDPSQSVVEAAFLRLGETTRADLGPLAIELLSHPRKPIRVGAIQTLAKFASAESLAPLAKLLDDPDIEIRGEALKALKSIRDTLQEKKEWQDLLEKLQKR